MSILELLLKCCLLFFLGGAARIDYLKRELPLIYIVVGFGAGLLLRILSGTAALAEILPTIRPCRSSSFRPGIRCTNPRNPLCHILWQTDYILCPCRPDLGSILL